MAPTSSRWGHGLEAPVRVSTERLASSLTIRTFALGSDAMRVLVTAGPTREYFDTVRFLSNASSGRMGYAIAAAAGRRGHDVVLISGPVERSAPVGVEVVRVVSAAEMLQAAVEQFATAQVAVMVAAVADYRPVTRAHGKQAKTHECLYVALEPTEDICARLGRTKGRRIVVGFALEDHDHHAHAEEKLRRKGCDAIVLNRVETAGAADAEIEILCETGGWGDPFRGNKDAVAVEVVALTEALVAARR